MALNKSFCQFSLLVCRATIWIWVTNQNQAILNLGMFLGLNYFFFFPLSKQFLGTITPNSKSISLVKCKPNLLGVFVQTTIICWSTILGRPAVTSVITCPASLVNRHSVPFTTKQMQVTYFSFLAASIMCAVFFSLYTLI